VTKLSIGVLGTARIARTMIPHINASSDAAVVAVASRSKEKAQQFAAEFQVPHACGSYQELLERDDVNAVYIPLPPAMHCEWTLKAAEAGKHILCEKPVGISSTEVRHMIQAARNNSVVLLDGVMWYHTSRARELKRLAEDGSLGELRQVTSAFTFPGNVLAAENLRFSEQLGGGSLLDIGWYCVGVSLWMLNAMPDRVFAAAQWKHNIDMHLNGLMWFPEDRVASFESGFTAIRRRWVEICGSKAALVCDDFTRPWNADKPRFWLHDENGVSHPHVFPHPPVEQCLVDAFCDLIRRREINHSWLPLSLNTQIVCEALLKSARSGSVEPLPCDGISG
jgi:predicted dehydrogenase